jgi:hypothetical protein
MTGDVIIAETMEAFWWLGAGMRGDVREGCSRPLWGSTC